MQGADPLQSWPCFLILIPGVMGLRDISSTKEIST